MSPGWVPLTDYARSRAVHPQTMRRRLLALAYARGRSEFLCSTHQPGRRARRYWVQPELLKTELERDPDTDRAELDSLAAEVEKLRETVEALKNWRKHLKKLGFFKANRT